MWPLPFDVTGGAQGRRAPALLARRGDGGERTEMARCVRRGRFLSLLLVI